MKSTTDAVTEAETESTNNGGNQRNSILTRPRWPSYSSRRTASISSVSSISSNSSFRSCSHEERGDSSPASPSTPLCQIPAGGIPFSWESIPGIPKKQILKKIDSSASRNQNQNHLPLPPVFSTTTKPIAPSPRRDPFFAALVECSKGGGIDDGDNGGSYESSLKSGGARRRNGRSCLNNLNMSCKSASAVVESLVLLPRGPRRITYDVLKKSPR